MSKIIGKCLGEYIKEEDVLYDPLKDTYKIKAGDRIVEIPGHVLQSENLRTLKEALSNVDDENIKMDMLGSWAKANQTPHTAKEIVDQMQEAVEKLNRLENTLDDDLDTKYRRTYLGDWGERAGKADNLSSKTSGSAGAAGAPFDSQSFDPLRARVEAAGTEAGAWRMNGLGASVRPVDTGDWSVRISDKATQKITGAKTYGDAARKLTANSVYGVGTASHTSAPWDDPLKGQIDKANNTVACMDKPEMRPDYNPNAEVKVYYHDRFPSIPIRSIIDDAIELLNNKKKLHISKISFHNEKFSDQDYRLAISSLFPTNVVLRKTLEVVINHRAFDRAYKTELDEYAGLKARLDTNTYIKLRIAFLLYEAIKLRDEDARKISLDIFRIMGSDTRPDFTI